MMRVAGVRRLTDGPAAVAWLRARGAIGLSTDSRQLKPGQAFIAWPGGVHDGRHHVSAALACGACACLVEAAGVERFDWNLDDRVAAVPGLKAMTGVVADAFYGHPSRQLDVLAVTGTNGKTSTAWWLAQALASRGVGAGVIGTLGVGVPPVVVPTGLTTPDPVTLHATFGDFVQRGFKAAAIEASSIGVSEQRLAGATIAVALLTNFTQDHLDYHGSMAAYWAAKAALFDWPGLRAAVINVDDAQGAALAAQWAAGGGPEAPGRSDVDLITYAVAGEPGRARLQAQSVSYRQEGLAFEVLEFASGPNPATATALVPVAQAEVCVAVVGDFNVPNLLAVIGGLRALGWPLATAARACAGLTPVPGRMQRVPVPGEDKQRRPLAIVDYAHTPDALDKALRALRPLAQARGGRLWCVFGCGGNRDAGKRPLMGRVAQTLADAVVVTSDNPRGEAPQAIVAAIMTGTATMSTTTAPVDVVVDRAEAIRHALGHAQAEDVVLVAGKGHEDYQEVAGVKHPFSDVDVAQAVLSTWTSLQGAGR